MWKSTIKRDYAQKFPWNQLFSKYVDLTEKNVMNKKLPKLVNMNRDVLQVLFSEIPIKNNFHRQDIFNSLSFHLFEKPSSSRSEEKPKYHTEDLEFIQNGGCS